MLVGSENCCRIQSQDGDGEGVNAPVAVLYKVLVAAAVIVGGALGGVGGAEKRCWLRRTEVLVAARRNIGGGSELKLI
nr:hypothetical protein [Tanacetum cinerariifolium]